MATRQSNGTGGGNWSDTASWSGGVVPVVGVDDAQIVSGDTITKDTAKNASKDALTCTVDSGGVLDIGSNGIKVTKFAGSGIVQAGDNAQLETTSYQSAQQPTFQLQGSSGNEITFLYAGGRVDGSENRSNPLIFQFVDIDQQNAGTYMIAYGINGEDILEDTEWHDSNYDGFYLYTGSTLAVLRRCYFSSHGRDGLVTAYAPAILYDCRFGKTRSGSSDTNSGSDLKITYPVEAHNTELASTTPYTLTSAVASFFRSKDHQMVIGDWLFATWAGHILRSAAAKNAGDYGIEMVPNSNCEIGRPLCVDFPIPADSGDGVAPEIEVYNATADLNVQDAADQLVFELDPGDAWGLNEIIDANTLADVYLNSRTVSFTGGTAGGTGKKGTVILRVYLKKYVASGVIYLRDMDLGIS